MHLTLLLLVIILEDHLGNVKPLSASNITTANGWYGKLMLVVGCRETVFGDMCFVSV